MIEIDKFKCTNCGDCCGPVPVTQKEFNKIKRIVKKYPAKFKRIQKQEKGKLTCIFRDQEKNCCSIYDARPEICKRFGFYERLVCPNNRELATKNDKWLKEENVIGILSIQLGWNEFLKG